MGAAAPYTRRGRLIYQRFFLRDEAQEVSETNNYIEAMAVADAAADQGAGTRALAQISSCAADHYCSSSSLRRQQLSRRPEQKTISYQNRH